MLRGATARGLRGPPAPTPHTASPPAPASATLHAPIVVSLVVADSERNVAGNTSPASAIPNAPSAVPIARTTVPNGGASPSAAIAMYSAGAVAHSTPNTIAGDTAIGESA